MNNSLEICQLIDEVNNITEQINSQGDASKDQINQLICTQGDLISKLLEHVELAGEVQKANLKFIFKLMDIINKKGVRTENGEITISFEDDEIENLNKIMKEAIAKGFTN